MGPNLTEKFLHGKRNHQQNETNKQTNKLLNGENISKSYDQRDYCKKIYKVYTIQHPKPKKLN